MVTSELTFYLAAAALLVLTVESCVKLLNGDSFSITLAVYVTVFGWYFVDPFLNPEQYTYIPSFLISESYGQEFLFLIDFRRFLACWRFFKAALSGGVLLEQCLLFRSHIFFSKERAATSLQRFCLLSSRICSMAVTRSS